jgi:hypothetical protein
MMTGGFANEKYTFNLLELLKIKNNAINNIINVISNKLPPFSLL